MPDGILLIDIGSTFTKVTLVDCARDAICGTARAPTTAAGDISDGIENALTLLRSKIGEFTCRESLICSSAAGGLKMVAVGLVPDLTVEAAKTAALTAGAKLLRSFAYELTEQEAAEIRELNPDIVLLSGGTDGGNKDVIQHNAAVLARIPGSFCVVVAGNKTAANPVAATLRQAGKDVRLCPNVMPDFGVLQIEPARQAIRSVFLERIVVARGLDKVEDKYGRVRMPTPSAVLQAAQLLADGTAGEAGIGELMVLDVGGATTDVFSVAFGHPFNQGVTVRGLPEPYAKRTVEGDIGVRHNAASVVATGGPAYVAACTSLPEAEVAGLVDVLQHNPAMLATDNPRLAALDGTLTSLCVRLGAERHVGRIATVYTPLGVQYVLTGKDLTGIKTVVATGGPLIGTLSPATILSAVRYDPAKPDLMKPRDCRFLLDRHYILAAMGLLGDSYPDKAVRLMKQELELIA